MLSDFVNSLDWHTSIFDWQLPFLHVCGLAISVGLVLGGICRASYGSFFVWGVCVGIFLSMLGWVCTVLVPAKWGLVIFVSVTLPLAVMKYIDENIPVTADELRKGARDRGIGDLTALFRDDPDAAQSIADTLNSGIDACEHDWPETSIWRGIPRKVFDRSIAILGVGYGIVLAASLVIIYWS